VREDSDGECEPQPSKEVDQNDNNRDDYYQRVSVGVVYNVRLEIDVKSGGFLRGARGMRQVNVDLSPVAFENK